MKNIHTNLKQLVSLMGFKDDKAEQIERFIEVFGDRHESVLYPRQQGFELTSDHSDLIFKLDSSKQCLSTFTITQSVDGFGNLFDCEELLDIIGYVVPKLESELRLQKLGYQVDLEKGRCSIEFRMDGMVVEGISEKALIQAMIDYASKKADG